MWLWLVFVAFSSAGRTPSCLEGTLYGKDGKFSNKMVPQAGSPFACNFQVYYKLNNLTGCSFQNKTGECFYDRLFFGNRRFLQCRCAEDGCNNKVAKIRPLFDAFRYELKKSNKAIEQQVVDCIEHELEELRLLPGRIPVEVLEEAALSLYNKWTISVSMAVLCLLFLVMLYFLSRRCCSRRPPALPAIRYEWWNVVDPAERGYQPVDGEAKPAV